MVTTKVRPTTWLAAVAALVLLGLLGALAIQMAGGPSATPDEAGVLEVEVSGFAFTPQDLAVTADTPLTLVFHNSSEVTHNVAIGRRPISEGGREIGFGDDLLALVGARAAPGNALLQPADPALPWSINVHPDQRVEISMTVPSSLVGEWEVGCMVGPGCDPRLREGARLLVE